MFSKLEKEIDQIIIKNINETAFENLLSDMKDDLISELNITTDEINEPELINCIRRSYSIAIEMMSMNIMGTFKNEIFTLSIEKLRNKYTGKSTLDNIEDMLNELEKNSMTNQ